MPHMLVTGERTQRGEELRERVCTVSASGSAQVLPRAKKASPCKYPWIAIISLCDRFVYTTQIGMSSGEGAGENGEEWGRNGACTGFVGS